MAIELEVQGDVTLIARRHFPIEAKQFRLFTGHYGERAVFRTALHAGSGHDQTIFAGNEALEGCSTGSTDDLIQHVVPTIRQQHIGRLLTNIDLHSAILHLGTARRPGSKLSAGHDVDDETSIIGLIGRHGKCQLIPNPTHKYFTCLGIRNRHTDICIFGELNHTQRRLPIWKTLDPQF